MAVIRYRKFALRTNLTLTPTKSGYLAIGGIEDCWLKESNDKPKGGAPDYLRDRIDRELPWWEKPEPSPVASTAEQHDLRPWIEWPKTRSVAQ